MLDKIVNNSGKILVFFLNALIITAGVLGIKIQSDKKELARLKESIEIDQTANNLLDIQRQIAGNREANLSKIANSPKQVVTQNEVTSTVIPGKLVPQTTTVTTSGGSGTKKSTSTKTTKSS